ncbi:uncharacterized protein LOC125560599 [Nematostella vectensis]|uniref:uncharacterized protein LOC125560599 n=1 Tax=Nematostella vectensis TaxID=45351 RepID=UPI00207723AA|nr:uncharacterized protein LOC125560599 [Nematostella vectensis]
MVLFPLFPHFYFNIIVIRHASLTRLSRTFISQIASRSAFSLIQTASRVLQQQSSHRLRHLHLLQPHQLPQLQLFHQNLPHSLPQHHRHRQPSPLHRVLGQQVSPPTSSFVIMHPLVHLLVLDSMIRKIEKVLEIVLNATVVDPR